MGLGDWIMASADVKAMHEAYRIPVCVVGRDGRPCWSEVFENNPRISRSRDGSQELRNGPGIRPYIANKTTLRWTWKRQRSQKAGEIYLTDAEREFGAPYKGHILIEPNVKATNGHTNKAWPFERWQAVARDIGVPLVQVGSTPTTRWLEGAARANTPTFRHACAVLAHCVAFVGTEGALHHAAAALGVPAVVLWSEFISPDVTGYESQKNIRHAGEPCGSRIPCQTCAASMAAIGVEEVTDTLGRLL